MAKILVVDDSPSIRALVGDALEEMGHVAIPAKDAYEALARVDERVIDAVVTDYHMPGMNGVELIVKLRKLARFKSKPILVLSTEINPAVKQAAREAGATGFGNKPLDKERFVAMITRLVT